MAMIASDTFSGVGTRSPHRWGVASFRSRLGSVRWAFTG